MARLETLSHRGDLKGLITNISRLQKKMLHNWSKNCIRFIKAKTMLIESGAFLFIDESAVILRRFYSRESCFGVLLS
ncbi:hypothetical protein FKM82_022362 [Ascaphus truei]